MRTDAPPQLLTEALGEAWARATAESSSESAFTELKDRAVPEIRWPRRRRGSSDAATRCSSAKEIRMREFTIREIGKADHSGSPVLDTGSLTVRFPIRISSVSVSSNVDVLCARHHRQAISEARLLIKFEPLHCDVLGKIGIDRITSRPYTIVYGFDIPSARISFAELVDPAGTDQMHNLSVILSDPGIHGGMTSAVQLLMGESRAIDDFQVRINKALIQSWSRPPTIPDALTLAAESCSQLSVGGIELIARRYGMESNFGPVGIPDIQTASCSWNAFLSQRFATVHPDQVILRKDISIAFRVHGNGQVFTLVNI